MKNKQVAIVIPTYKESLNNNEIISLTQTAKVFGNYPIFFLTYEGLCIDSAKELVPNAEVTYMDKEYFDGFSGYNSLMMSTELYEKYLDYEYVLICQQDVFVIEDKLESFLNLPYDYIGAPIPHMGPWSSRLYVGNGGFSLRRVDAVLSLLKDSEKDIKTLNDNEDVFYSNVGEKHSELFRTAPVEVGLNFAFNMYYEELYRLNDSRLPMAIHGFGSGDGEFIHKHLDSIDPEYKIENDNSWEKELSKLYDFVDQSDNICLYGAGDAGEIFTEILKKRGKKVTAYLISDGQSIPNKKLPAPIYNLSDYLGEWATTDVLITISSRYKKLPDFAAIVREKGSCHVMGISNELFHAAISLLIES